MRTHSVMLAPAVGLVLTMAGCALEAHRSSPWEYGGGIHVAPGWALAGGDVSVHPHVGYSYLSFDGGHDGLFEVGAQVRKSLPLFGEEAGSGWIGAEANVAHLGSSWDFEGTSYTSGVSGFSVLGLIGAPVGESRWGVNLYGGAGVSRLGGATGINVRLGVDLQPWFLRR